MQHLTYITSSNNQVKFQSYDSNYLEHLVIDDAQAQEESDSPLRKIKVLVVEDDPINQHVTKLLLENKGYLVDIAPTGKSALELYQAKHYRAILMDMGLPDMQGTEVTRQIRKLEQVTSKHIPIIALTANGISAKSECLSAGMDDFFIKPFEIYQLNKLLRAWIFTRNQLRSKEDKAKANVKILD